MTVEQMKKEVLYYRGKPATDTEAMELLCFREDNPEADLSELISEYYSCANSEEDEDDPKVEALQLIDEIKACLYNIEDFGEQGGYIDEPVLDYIDTLSEKVRELECKITAI